MRAYALPLTLVAGLLAGCPQNDGVKVVPLEGGQPAQVPQGDDGHGHGGNLPEGHPPLGGSQQQPVGPARQGAEMPNDAIHAPLRGSGAMMPGDLAPPPPPGIALKPPAGWVAERPSSSMRVAQFRLPAPGGADGEGQLAVFFFGGTAGGVDANMNRWLGQLQVPGGQSPREAATFEEETVGTLKISYVELSGTYVAETMPGSGVRENKPGYTLLGAIIQPPDQNFYFVKALGPAATMAHHKAAFRAYARSAANGS